MLTERRHEIILNLLKEKGSITVTEIRELLNISESTARRDLTELDRDHKLTKVFGGAVLNENVVLTKELSVSQKAKVHLSEKNRIARYAASLIEPDDLVFLDAGTTTERMIEYLTQQNVTFVTNAVSHAQKLVEKKFHVIILGGELKGTTEAIVGSQTILTLSQYHFTKGFFGTNGIHRRSGFTTPDSNEAMVKRIAMEHSMKRYILADSEKFEKVSSVAFGAYEDANIITDANPPELYRGNKQITVVES